MFDRDGNGDATLDEVEMACLDVHRERKALASSMRDIDSAVGRLDSIIVSLWYIVSIIIIVGLLDASFQTMIAGYVLRFFLNQHPARVPELMSMQRRNASPRIVLALCAHGSGDPRFHHLCLHQARLRRRRPSRHRRRVIRRQGNGPALDHLPADGRQDCTGPSLDPQHQVYPERAQEWTHHGKLCVGRRLHYEPGEGTSSPSQSDARIDEKQIEALRERMLEFLELERRDFLPKIDISVRGTSSPSPLSSP